MWEGKEECSFLKKRTKKLLSIRSRIIHIDKNVLLLFFKKEEFLLLFLCFGVSAAAAEPSLTPAGARGTAGAAMATDVARQGKLPPAAKQQLLRQHIKYVFVLFQENRSFDHYFGTYPGANGLQASFPGAVTSLPANRTASWNQVIAGLDGKIETMHPFLVPRALKRQDGAGAPVDLYPEDLLSVDHSHYGMLTSLHLDTATLSHAKNDAYALSNEGLAYLTDASGPQAPVVQRGSSVSIPPTNTPASGVNLYHRQAAEVAISHVDCDTIPFLWLYADRFALLDNFHQTVIGPSTPNAIAMIAAQAGDTQWALHPGATGRHAGVGAPEAVPNETDTPPYAGSAADIASLGGHAVLPPFGPDEQNFGKCAKPGAYFDNRACPMTGGPGDVLHTDHAAQKMLGPPGAYDAGQMSLTFASLPLSFMGANAADITQLDYHPATDLADVGQDVRKITDADKQVDWAWYQQGYGPEPFDDKTVGVFPPGTSHASYIVHHNGPQYFGYLGDNPRELAHLHGLQQFYTDVAARKLPAAGGVFYVRGGFFNNDRLVPIDPNPVVQAMFAGNDDHGSYSDSQISEAFIADSVNAIAASPYWAHSAIIITYDESDGFFDHAPLRIRTFGPDGLPETGGPRIPAIVISPYGASHVVSHVYSEHGSVIKFINQLFGLVPLNALPDEAGARALGATEQAVNSPFGPQTQLGPNDGDAVGDLAEAFDDERLQGNAAPVPAQAAMIQDKVVKALPHFGGAGCAALHITPTDYDRGYGTGLENDPPPPDFNPRPSVSVAVPPGAQAVGARYEQNIPGSGMAPK
jgi:phospholipase C